MSESDPILTVKVKNDGTGDNLIANYDYVVMMDDKVIETGHIDRHNRLTGWPGVLLSLVWQRNIKPGANGRKV